MADVDLEIVYEKSRKGDLGYSYADVSKARDLLGYDPKMWLKDGLGSVFERSTIVSDEIRRACLQE